ncbi:MAG: hypothetical protein HYR62_02015 [Actinobacteria bacterium]|nr:hypothetical protein [Actinomycetota bacterium]MBI3687259.1 hypothetical protein [Actinomycetota bacterium]
MTMVDDLLAAGVPVCRPEPVVTRHDLEWVTTPRRVESRHAHVTIAREVRADGRTVYHLTGGRIGQAPTWRAAIPGCSCALPACWSARKVFGYRPPGWTWRTSVDRRTGRDHPDACRERGHCHGHTGYTPACVLAIARAALATWAPTRSSRTRRST